MVDALVLKIWMGREVFSIFFQTGGPVLGQRDTIPYSQKFWKRILDLILGMSGA